MQLTPCSRSVLRLGMVAWWVGILPVQADVRLHNLFTDHMVLQRDAKVPVWGWADEAELVTVEFRNQKATTRARDGKWHVELAKLAAGGPDDLKITGKTSVIVHDVLVGEVWIASGQSNMEWPLRASFEPDADIAAADNPKLRLFTVPKLKASAPTNNVEASWEVSSPASVPNFSAVAYYFGRYLQKQLGVPVGVIHTSWGGSPAEVWIREQVLAANPRYKRDILEDYQTQLKRHEAAVAQFESEQAEAKRTGAAFDKPRPALGWKPCELYNGMIAPIIPFAIQGAIWYQGESNAGRAHQYRTLFADMIKNWRQDWDQGDFPFLLVQLAPFMPIKAEPGDSAWAELREAQELATRVLPRVGMAVITDLGDEKDIHPRWKKPVAQRLSLLARGIAYHEPLVDSGPALRGMKVKGGRAILSFDHVGQGLIARPLPPGVKAQNGESPTEGILADLRTAQVEHPLAGFSVAGADRKFFWAHAEIHGDQVIVSSPQVARPIAVRYGWADYPVVNLFCHPGAGLPPLPASPFRTDDWPMITAPQKPAKP